MSQVALNIQYERVRATEQAPRDPHRVLERRHGLAEIVERGVGVPAERLCVKFPYSERDFIALAENASRHGHNLAHYRLGFFEAL